MEPRKVTVTTNQRRVLEEIAAGWARSEPPSFRELAAMLGATSPNAAMVKLARLRELGLVEWKPKVARSVRLTAAGARVLGS